MHTTHSEEDYLKSIGLISNWADVYVNTNKIAAMLKTSPAAITDMLKKLSQKKLVEYIKYRGVKLNKEGEIIAKQVLRRQRLWQYFLVNKLKFGLDEVASVVEELEHINHDVLTKRLDDHLGNPTYSPFGEPIPNSSGVIQYSSPVPLSDFEEGLTLIVVGIKETNPDLMKYLFKKGIYVGAKINIIEIMRFDSSLDISVDGQLKVNISNQVAKNILVT